MTQEEALKILKMGHSVFLTGEPGAGKTFVVNDFVYYLRSHNIEPAITASTGIAATHIGGTTIHSWSGVGIKQRLTDQDLEYIKSNKNVARRIKKTEILIIDEISMLTPEILDSVDLICRAIKDARLPFGGIQVILVGDFFQLPPVNKYQNNSSDFDGFSQFADEFQVSKFAYQSSAWRNLNPKICYLTEQHRQEDRHFLSVLTAIRENKFNNDHLGILISPRVQKSSNTKYSLKLFTHNANVDRLNDEMLAKIGSQAKEFIMTSRGPDMIVANLKKNCLSPEKLALKIGAKVMFTKNSPKDGYFNGTLGTVSDFNAEDGLPVISLKNGRRITVTYADWKLEIDGYSVAQITQLPLRLAWAITVHKSQGMSLDEATIDLSNVFEFGQGYVALSRLKTLDGLNLVGHNEHAFMVDPDILAQDRVFKDLSVDAEIELNEMNEELINNIINNNLERLGSSDNHVTSNKIKPRETNTKTVKPKSHDVTFDYFKEGLTLEATANARDMTVDTVITHLAKLKSENKLNKIDLEKILFKHTEAEKLIELTDFINSTQDIRLKSIFDKFEGKYSYTEIKLAFLLID